MKIAVIGAGAIGLLFSAKLVSAGHEIFLVAREKHQSGEINLKGIHVHSDQVEITSSTVVSGVCLPHEFKADCVIVTVKQYHLESLKKMLASIPGDIPLIFAQNGMGHIEFMSGLANTQLFVSTIEHGVKKESPTEVRHNGIGAWKIAAFRGNMDCINFLQSSDPSFPVSFWTDYQSLLLEKLIKNILINSLTSLFEVKNGELLTNPFLNKNLQHLYSETMLLFPQMKHMLTLKDVESLCDETSKNTSSMSADLQSNRKTEVDAIIGFALKTAKEKQITVPLLQFVYDGICAIEYGKGIRG
ncbi:2-dehydropantoate 2-reductase [Jeotgalibacillus sp. S-D1]|uniref:ketopantoate reductase family protein n=1 Tax=Jeotgalibacillus sp. S-D1 TaxID=2552189 RepID=UPI00105AAE25|nr:2-dehydropantoate 2-reductase [Jeotgalibacillus sp. S-D1]TDL35132.1 2-dehydropantoate 2-reductase [Jeotgalibacillus sp. S-D1]